MFKRSKGQVMLLERIEELEQLHATDKECASTIARVMIDWRERHTALCDAVAEIINYMPTVAMSRMTELLDAARIQTIEKLTLNSETEEAISSEVSVIIEQFIDDCFQLELNEDISRYYADLMRPHIEKLAERAEKAEAERDEADANSKKCCEDYHKIKSERDAMREQKDNAYTERNRVVSALATAMIQLGHKAFIMPHKSDDADWGEWQNVVCIEIDGFGQFTWHIHDRHLPIFSQLKHVDENVWDGHDTEDKYTRLNSVAKWMY